ncbi:MAG: hypothetical protein H0U56_07710, partial [Methylibium sp.]|nr:hypothetical protein [Methylibium sp.]
GTLSTAGGKATVMYSDPGGAPGGNDTDWKDNASGLFNQLVIGSNDGDTCIGFGKVGRDLAVFKRRSIWLISGQTISSLTVQRASDEIGCVSRDSIVSSRDGVYFLSDRGMMYFDGAQMTNVSDPSVRSEHQSLIRQMDTRLFSDGVNIPPGNSVTPCYSLADLGTGHIVMNLSVGMTSLLDNDRYYVSLLSMIYDVERRTWTRFTAQTTLAYQGMLFEVNNRPALWNDTSVVFLDELTIPETLKDSLRGKDVVNGATLAIPCTFHTRLISLSSPALKSQLHRVLVDYAFARDGIVDEGVSGWGVEVLDGNGTLLHTFSLLAQADPAVQLERKRSGGDVFAEATDIQLRFTNMTGATPNPVVAEIYDATIEFQASHQRLRDAGT